MNREIIVKQANNLPQQNEERILCYLKSAIDFEQSFGFIKDCFSDEYISGEAFATYTDGRWVWDKELIYHVEKYHCRISDEFRRHMENSDWEIPQKYRRGIDDKFIYDEDKIKSLWNI